MRLVVSWLRDFVDVKAPAEEIAETLGLRGFEVASVEALGADDAVIDVEVTANRPDCLSVIGLAREVATAYDLPMTPGAATAAASVPAGESDRVAIAIEDPSVPVRRLRLSSRRAQRPAGCRRACRRPASARSARLWT
jgi:phenylalanyl-tRNA synthetase beta chain